MAESIISPGVFTRENDISFIQPAPVAAGAAFIGPTVKGPNNQPTIVTSYNDYTRKFGETFISGSSNYEFLTSMAVKNYFSQGGQTALVTRVVSGSYTAADSTRVSSNTTDIVGGFASNSLNFLASLVPTSSNYPVAIKDPSGNIFYFIPNTFTYTSAELDYAYFDPNAGSPDWTTAQYITALGSAINNMPGIGVTATSSSNTLILSASTAGTVNNGPSGYQLYTGTASPAGPGTPLSSFSGYINLLGGTQSTSTNTFTISTLGEGIIFNNSTSLTNPGATNSDGSLVSGSADNLRWEIQNVDNTQGTFTLLIRRGDDSTNNKTVLESFSNLSLDPNSPNFIEFVIGNQYKEVLPDSAGNNYLGTVGTYPNKSNYIRVKSVTRTTPNYLANDGRTVNRDSTGTSYSASLPLVASGSFYGATGTVKSGASYFANITSTSNDIQGLVGANYTTAIDILSNKDDYQFNVIATPGLIYTNGAADAGATSVINSVISLAETRGDCIAVVDLVGTGAGVSTVTGEAVTLNSSYAAAYWPWVQMKSATGQNQFVPASTIIPGVYAFTDAASAPWYAPAGLVRGGIPGVIQAERKLTKGDRDNLYLGKVNPIASFPGTGIAVFGQKTLQTKASALDRVNVRRLLIELKKFIGDQARNLVFEQNTITTRNKFLAIVNPYLESVVQRQGLYAFRVVMDDTNNTADVVDRNQLVGQIFIQPAKTIEFVVLDFTIEPTGATFA